MFSNISAIAVITLGVVVTNCLAQPLTYDERCEVIEGNGIRVDECDGRKFLSCKSGRCQCPDPASHIYTFHWVRVPGRTRRSPGKFKSRGIGKGIVAGAVGAAVATSPRKTEQPKYVKRYSCYGRAGAQCVLVGGAPNVPHIDTWRILRCIQNAHCTRDSTSKIGINNGTSVAARKGDDYDPRIGVCQCAPGYQRTSRDTCSATEKMGTGASIAGILAPVLGNRMIGA